MGIEVVRCPDCKPHIMPSYTCTVWHVVDYAVPRHFGDVYEYSDGVLFGFLGEEWDKHDVILYKDGQHDEAIQQAATAITVRALNVTLIRLLDSAIMKAMEIKHCG